MALPNLGQSLLDVKRRARTRGITPTRTDVRGIVGGFADTAGTRLAQSKSLGLQERGLGLQEKALGQEKELTTAERLSREKEAALGRTFASTEAGKERAFAGEQAGLGRTFTAEQAALSRSFQAGESALQRGFMSDESRLQRMFTGQQSALDRAFTAAENALGRTLTREESNKLYIHQASQSQLQRDSVEGMEQARLAEEYRSNLQQEDLLQQARNIERDLGFRNYYEHVRQNIAQEGLEQARINTERDLGFKIANETERANLAQEGLEQDRINTQESLAHTASLRLEWDKLEADAGRKFSREEAEKERTLQENLANWGTQAQKDMHAATLAENKRASEALEALEEKRIAQAHTLNHAQIDKLRQDIQTAKWDQENWQEKLYLDWWAIGAEYQVGTGKTPSVIGGFRPENQYKLRPVGGGGGGYDGFDDDEIARIIRISRGVGGGGSVSDEYNPGGGINY